MGDDHFAHVTTRITITVWVGGLSHPKTHFPLCWCGSDVPGVTQRFNKQLGLFFYFTFGQFGGKLSQSCSFLHLQLSCPRACASFVAVAGHYVFCGLRTSLQDNFHFVQWGGESREPTRQLRRVQLVRRSQRWQETKRKRFSGFAWVHFSGFCTWVGNFLLHSPHLFINNCAFHSVDWKRTWSLPLWFNIFSKRTILL